MVKFKKNNSGAKKLKNSFRFHVMSFILLQFEKSILMFPFTCLAVDITVSLFRTVGLSYKEMRHEMLAPVKTSSGDCSNLELRLCIPTGIRSVVHCQKFVRRVGH